MVCNSEAKTTKAPQVAEAAQQFSGYVLPRFNDDQCRAYFDGLTDALEREKHCFNSFSVCCDSILQSAIGAANGKKQPNALVTSVAAMLLSQLSHTVDRYGPLMRRLLDVVFRSTFVTLPEGGADGWSEGNGRCFIRTPIYSDHNDALREELDKLNLRMMQQSQTLANNAKMLSRFAVKGSDELKSRAFKLWRAHVQKTRRNTDKWVGFSQTVQQKFIKQTTFVHWVNFVHQSSKRSMARVAAENSDRMTERSKELLHLCTIREDEITKQRTAKEKLARRVERVEEMLTTEREDHTRARTKLYEAETQVKSLTSLVTAVLAKLETMTMMLASGTTKPVEAAGSRDNLQRRDALTTGATTFAAPGKGPQFSLPVVPPGGVASGTVYIGNVRNLLMQWVNETMLLLNSSLHVTNLGQDLNDGRVILNLLQYVLQMPTLVANTGETRTERCETSVRVARHGGCDVGVEAEDIMNGDESKCVPLLCALFTRYASALDTARSVGKATTGETTEVLLQLIGRFEAVQENIANHERWVQLSNAVGNFGQSLVMRRARGLTPHDDPVRVAFTTINRGLVKQFIPPHVEGVEGSDTEIVEVLSNELQIAFSAEYDALREVFFSYCAACASDVSKPQSMDANGVLKLLQDSKLAVRVVSKAHADAVLKSCGAVTGSGAVEHATFSAFLVGLVTMRYHVSEAAAAALSAAAGGNPTVPKVSVDALSNEFRLLVASIVQHAHRCNIERWQGLFMDKAVQETVKTHQDTLRKILHEHTHKETSRMRHDGFVAMCKEGRLGVESTECTSLYHALRQVDEEGAGIGYTGFTLGIFILSRYRPPLGPLQPTHDAFGHFITHLANMYQQKAKGKW